MTKRADGVSLVRRCAIALPVAFALTGVAGAQTYQAPEEVLEG